VRESVDAIGDEVRGAVALPLIDDDAERRLLPLLHQPLEHRMRESDVGFDEVDMIPAERSHDIRHLCD
jgi:hypothetical protein